MKKITMSLLVILLIELPTSSFFLEHYLTQVIVEGKQSNAQLNFALKQDNLAALRFVLQQSPVHSEQWLALTKRLAKTQGESAYQLAVYYQDTPVSAIFWYKHAIRLHFDKASIALAQYYFKHDKPNKASAVLATLPNTLTKELSTKENILKAKVAIKLGDVEEVKKLINLNKSLLQETQQGTVLLSDITKYQVLRDKNEKRELSRAAASCDNSIQFFATSLEHMKRIENLIIDFKKQALNNAVCFSPIRYIPIKELVCNNDPDQAIRCNELNWQYWANTINSRYLAIMLPKGGANVHQGILYFDAQDTVDVLAHEISHLLGFIDEYPLSSGHTKCKQSQKEIFSQNISILKNQYQGDRETIRSQVLKQLAWAKHIKASTPILQPTIGLDGEHYWLLGTPEQYKKEAGLFKAQTCNSNIEEEGSSFSAFKALLPRTKLQYFALDFPPLYSTLVEENANQYVMPSFHYNIALAAFQQLSSKHDALSSQKMKQAYYWLEQAIKRESDVSRREKLRQGKF